MPSRDGTHGPPKAKNRQLFRMAASCVSAAPVSTAHANAHGAQTETESKEPVPAQGAQGAGGGLGPLHPTEKWEEGTPQCIP